MKREFKFRSWDSIEKVMRYGVDIKNTISYGARTGIGTPNSFFHYWSEPDNETIMQYTGLKDSLKNEIYEGDIVKYFSNTYGTVYRWKISVVEYYRSYYGFKDIAWFYDEELTTPVPMPKLGVSATKNIPSDIWQSDLSKCEVIGNIFENSEKIKNSENEIKSLG